MDETKISKTLSYILRHGAKKDGIPIDQNGWIFLHDLNNHPVLKNLKSEDYVRIVVNNSKQRFSLQNDPNSKKLMIRANQGHSHTLQVNVQLEPIVPKEAIHGTYKKYINSILETGLNRRSRQHIHFTASEQNSKVISGARSDCNVFIFIDVEKAILAGIKFYKSANNVILSEGINGTIDSQYFKFVKYV